MVHPGWAYGGCRSKVDYNVKWFRLDREVPIVTLKMPQWAAHVLLAPGYWSMSFQYFLHHFQHLRVRAGGRTY